MASDAPDDDFKTPREKFLSLSLESSRKSYYPQLQKQLDIVRANERGLQLLLDNLPALVSYIDVEERFVSVNRAYEVAFGKSRSEIVGKKAVDLLGEANYRRMEARLREALHGKAVRFETHYQGADGGTSWLDIHYVPDVHPQRGVIGCYALIIDLTEKKAAEAEREKLEKMLLQVQKMESLGTLAGGIAHDFNNILSPLLGFADMLKEDLPKDSPLQSHVQEILRAAMRSRELVKQILAFSRQSEKEVIPMRAQPILKEAIRLLRSSIPATIEIQAAIDSQCGIVLADPTQLHQVIMNLATNAFHAMEEAGGTLRISLQQTSLSAQQVLPGMRAGDYARLSVADTGTGISPDIIHKIFDPYFTTKPRNKGTGLGLSIVQAIVKSFNGDVRVSSELGRGTVFEVYLPILEQNGEALAMTPAEPIQGGNERILLVDDEAEVAAMEQKLLERMGYRVTKAVGSLKALETFLATPDSFDLLFTDMTMPGMTGLQLAMKVKEIRPGLPVIICTGFSDRINEENAKSLGIDAYLMKPVVRQQLAETIRKVVRP